jgi:hypothetical protein
MKHIFKIVDKAFSHAPNSGAYNECKNIIWDRSGPVNSGDIVFFTDTDLYYVNSVRSDCKKMAWLIEPREINQSIYQDVLNLQNKFDLIFTHDDQLLSISSKYRYAPHCCTWVKPKDQKIHDKSLILSIIASEKRGTSGHILRHEVIQELNNSNIDIDCFGLSVGRYIDEKVDSLAPYRFSIIIENSMGDVYYTEKLKDSFLTGTIPIYWGARNIGKFYNSNGILSFSNIDELKKIISDLSVDRYESLMPYIKENFEIAQRHLTTEDFFFEENKNDILG